MDNFVCDKLIEILKGIKETNHTMGMDDPYENPDFGRDWYYPAERQHYNLIDKFVSTIKEQTDISKSDFK